MWNWLGITNDPKNPAKEDTEAEQQTSTKDEGTAAVGDSVEGKPKNQSKTEETQNSDDSAEKKMAEVASNLGNYLYNFASAATKTATATATKLKENVDQKLEKTIVGDFNRENEKFIQERDNRRIGDAVPPWVGFNEEKVMKSQILALSSDERNFLRDPPSGVDFQFDLQHMMPVALAVLKDDKDLETMRFTLVPKRIKEDRFWRNYFYRVSLIKQSTQLSSISNKAADKSEPTTPRETPRSPKDDVQFDESAGSPTAHEFVSDAFDDNAHLSEEEKTQMLGLNEDKTPKKDDEGDDSTTNNDWDLDKELQEELESFELVNESNANEDEDDEWQKEIEDLLEEEENSTKTS